MIDAPCRFSWESELSSPDCGSPKPTSTWGVSFLPDCSYPLMPLGRSGVDRVVTLHCARYMYPRVAGVSLRGDDMIPQWNAN